MNYFRKSVVALLLILAIAGIVQYRYDIFSFSGVTMITEKLHTLISGPAPCSEPIIYSIGQFDSQFRISRQQFISDIDKAAQIWNLALGKTLLKYSSDNTAGTNLSINLIYDYRQSATNNLQSIGSTISSDRSAFDRQKVIYDSLSASYATQKSAFQKQMDQYTVDKTAYENQVQYWSDRGGAPKSEFNTIEHQRQALNAEASSVSQSQKSLNATVDSLNSSAATLNLLAKKLNLNVKTYNSVGASTGLEFDEGEYVSDNSGQHISIYQFDNNTKLVRVLEHELGHALGLGHVDDPKAIMYRMNSGTNETPTVTDIMELQNVCMPR